MSTNTTTPMDPYVAPHTTITVYRPETQAVAAAGDTSVVQLKPVLVSIAPGMPFESVRELVQQCELNRELISALVRYQEKLASLERELAATQQRKQAQEQEQEQEQALERQREQVNRSRASTPKRSSSNPSPLRFNPNGQLCKRGLPLCSPVEEQWKMQFVYVRGLPKLPNGPLFAHLRTLRLHHFDIFHAYFPCSKVCQFVVSRAQAPRFVRALRDRDFVIIENYDPLKPVDPNATRTAVFGIRRSYCLQLAQSYRKSRNPWFRGFVEEYAKSIGLELALG